MKKNVHDLRRIARGHAKGTPEQHAKLVAAQRKIMEQLRKK